jgi:tetratricopeptide (TPR) repeat protein|tara:strand:+ start:131 stop:1441 length:1311 start_codon:yes stop_codon:yes gene_type:complete
MINLLKKLLFVCFLCFYYNSTLASSSSNFLISQSAFKNQDYSISLSNFSINRSNLSNENLLDNVVAAVIVGDMFLAEKISDEILLQDPNNQEAYIVKLTYFYQNGKFKEIDKIFKETQNKNELIDFIFFNNNNLKNNNTISKSLVDIVVQSYSNSNQRNLNYDFLLFYVSLAEIIDPTNDRATIIKGELFQNIRKDKEAREIFEKIKINSPYFIEAQKSLAYNFSTFLTFEEAEKEIKILLKNTNNNYFIKKVLGDFYRYEKKYDLAISIYNELIDEQENDLWKIFYMRGICYERLDNWKKAEKDFLTSLDLNPDSPDVLNYLAYGWIERDVRLDQSLQMLIEAYDANPDSFYIIDSLAWAYFKKNNLEEAARLMEKVIDMAPGEAISLDHLGDIYYAMNRKREAIHFWQQALELADPEDEIQDEVQNKIENFYAG